MATEAKISDPAHPPSSQKTLREKLGMAIVLILALLVTAHGFKVHGVGAATRAAKDIPAVATEAPKFAPTVANSTDPPSTAPTGMVWVPGGEFSMGASDT